jgi:hypothetical protein
VTCRDMDDVISSLLDNADDELLPSESLLRRIKTGIIEDLEPIRPLAPFRILFIGCAIIFLSVVAVGALLLGMNGWGVLSLVQRIIVFLTLAASAILLAISMIRQMVPGSRHILAPAVLLVSILVLLMMVIAATFRPQPESALLVNGVMCMKNGLTYSMPAGFLLWLILRCGAILYPRLTGAVAGGLAGLAGLSVLEINCPNLNVFHILAWHTGVVIIGSLGGAMLGAAVESIGRRRKYKGF